MADVAGDCAKCSVVTYVTNSGIPQLLNGKKKYYIRASEAIRHVSCPSCIFVLFKFYKFL